ncbi:MAG: hypothetical protein NPMRIOTA_90018 [Nitrosopumilales archaeon]|nr:MAG: hypothetical protein NPMRIOTA_90018 [Nitrosopumilales archaeon]
MYQKFFKIISKHCVGYSSRPFSIIVNIFRYLRMNPLVNNGKHKTCGHKKLAN